jgi:SAM-dependent methyltransferase
MRERRAAPAAAPRRRENMGIRDRLKTLFSAEAKPPPWHPDRGEDYTTFWTSMSQTDAEAQIATYGREVGDAERIQTCRYIARYIIEALEINETKSVLEVGCGIGTFAYLVGPKAKRYVGADISPHMVERARAFTRDAGGRLEFAVLSRSDLSNFADETFDAVFFEAVLMHVAREDAFNYLCEARRVLKPAGRFYASFQNLLQPLGFKHFLRLACEADQTGRHAIGRVRFHTAPELRHLAKMAGLEIDPRHARLELVENDPARHEARTLTIVAAKGEPPDWGVADGWPV